MSRLSPFPLIGSHFADFFLSSIPPYSSPYFSQTTASFSLPIHTHSINFLSLSFHLGKPKFLNKTLSQNNPHKCHSHYHCVHGRGQKPSSGSCLYNLPPYFFETGFLTKLRTCHLARLDGQQTPIIHLSLQLWSGYTHWKRKKEKQQQISSSRIIKVWLPLISLFTV